MDAPNQPIGRNVRMMKMPSRTEVGLRCRAAGLQKFPRITAQSPSNPNS
jgi:hypothetical protein